MPTTGTVTLSRTVVAGEAYVTANGTTTAYSLGNSQLSITIDYGNGLVTGRLTLIGTPVGGGADVSLITLDAKFDFSGLGGFNVASGSYAADSTSKLAGVFFGPKAAETGLLLHLSALNPSGATLKVVATGAAGS